MSELILMRKGVQEMYVKPEHLADYSKDGWQEIERVKMSGDNTTAAPKQKSVKPEAKTANN